MIDTLGGVSVNIPKKMEYHDYAGDLHIDFERGDQVLMGRDLLKYVRFRNDHQGDIGRIQRQQAVIKELLDQMFQ